MADNKCIICNKKKGKRLCPLYSRKICSSCCGKQIATSNMCLSSCSYRSTSLEYKRQKESTKNNSQFTALPVDALEIAALIENIERKIYTKIVKDPYYEDHHLYEAVSRVISHYKADSMTTEVLLNRVGILESLIKESISAHALHTSKFSTEKVINCMVIYQQALQKFSKNNAGSHAYIQSIVQRIGQQEKNKRQSSLII
ncbi:MAG: hypothetical protein ACMUJM_15690 [bacterium]